MIAFFESAEWKAVAGESSVAAEHAARAIESIHQTQGEGSTGKTRTRYTSLAILAPPCKAFEAQTHRSAYCATCFKRNCQRDAGLDISDAFPTSGMASLLLEQEKVDENHGRIDEDESELRLRERREDEPELSFPERVCWLLREADARTMVLSLLSNSTYGHHYLEFGDDLKWRERGKDGVAFGESLRGAVLTLLDDLQLAHLKGVSCSVEMKGVNSHATYSTNLQSVDELGAVGTMSKAQLVAAEAQVFKWWAADLPKAAVRAAVGGAGSGAYMIRKSSRAGTVVLVINDNGLCVDYAISWDESALNWSFVGHEFSRMDALLDMLNREPLTSKTGGFDVILKDPAPGGVEIDLEKELFGIELGTVNKCQIERVRILRAKSTKRKPTPSPQPEPEDPVLPPEELEEDYETMDHSNSPTATPPGKSSPETAETFGEWDPTAASADVVVSRVQSDTLDFSPWDPDEAYELPDPKGARPSSSNIRPQSRVYEYEEVAGMSNGTVVDDFDMDGVEAELPPENIEEDYDDTAPDNVERVVGFTGFGDEDSAVDTDEANFMSSKAVPNPTIDSNRWSAHSNSTRWSPLLVSVAPEDGEKLGFTLHEESVDGETQIRVRTVTPGGPADRGELRVGHHVLEINGRQLEDLGPLKTKKRASNFIKDPRPDRTPLTLMVVTDTKAPYATLPEFGAAEFDGFGTEETTANVDQTQPESATNTDPSLPPISAFWSTGTNDAVSSAVVAAGPGAFLVRSSSLPQQVVLIVCSESGRTIPHPLKYRDAQWSFASMRSATLQGLLESLQVKSIPGTKGRILSLTQPAPGGIPFVFAEWNKAASLTI